MTDYVLEQPTAIDPPGCGCTECITGEYVPLHRATEEHIVSLLNGTMRNHLYTGTSLQITVVFALANPRGRSAVLKALVTYHNPEGSSEREHGLSWELAPTQLTTLLAHFSFGG